MINGIWEEFLKIVKDEVGSRVVETWFRAVSLHQWDSAHKIAYVQAPNAFVKDWISANYVELIRTHLCRLLHVDTLKIIFLDGKHNLSAEITDDNPLRVTPALLIPSSSSSELPPVEKRLRQPTTINANYQFDSFVVGPSNSLAYAAAYAVTENPGNIYNPLFMYGESGLGKTHLLHAIGNRIKLINNKSTILYQTADRFVNEFINAIRFDKVHKFQIKYQHVDVLLIDDIQFISHKEQTQEAFFHIFNALYESGKQIVFSSDTYPQDIAGLAERLRSRLSCGLITDIHVPTLETKIAILKRKAEASNEILSDDVALFIASRKVANIRELEGALIRVIAFASLTKQTISLELVKKVLLRAHETSCVAIDFERILKAMHMTFDYSLQDLRSKNRSKDLSLVRQITMFFMKKFTDRSLRDIGAFLGGRDHSTVMHAIEKIQEYAKNNPEFHQQLERIEQDIKSL